MNENIDTVVFDLDGTLVDSQPAALGATIKALSHFDVQVTAADLKEVFGGRAQGEARLTASGGAAVQGTGFVVVSLRFSFLAQFGVSTTTIDVGNSNVRF